MISKNIFIVAALTLNVLAIPSIRSSSDISEAYSQDYSQGSDQNDEFETIPIYDGPLEVGATQMHNNRRRMYFGGEPQWLDDTPAEAPSDSVTSPFQAQLADKQARKAAQKYGQFDSSAEQYQGLNKFQPLTDGLPMISKYHSDYSSSRGNSRSVVRDNALSKHSTNPSSETVGFDLSNLSLNQGFDGIGMAPRGDRIKAYYQEPQLSNADSLGTPEDDEIILE